MAAINPDRQHLDRQHPVRVLALIAVGISLGMVALALLPLLMHQISLRHDRCPAREIRLIPLVPESPQEIREHLEKPLPEPPPEPDVAIEPPDLQELMEPEPPELPQPETVVPELAVEPVAMEPVTMAPVRLTVPSLAPVSVKSMAVNAALVGRGHVRAPMPRALSRPPRPAAMSLARTTFNLDEVDRMPVGISTVQPVYPYRARRMAIEGYVSVRFLVDSAGEVRELTVLDASPADVFEKTVEKTLGSWRFKPAQKNGKPVDTWVKTTIRFKLDDAS